MSNDKHIPKNPPVEIERTQHGKQNDQQAVNQADGSKDELNTQRGQKAGQPIQTGKPVQTGQDKGAERGHESHKPDGSRKTA